MARKIDEETQERRERKRAARESVEGTPEGPARTFKGQSGYEYTRGSDTPSRLSKYDWDHMSQEERDAIGVSTWDQAKNIFKNWRSGFAPGGGNFQNQQAIKDALISSGASTRQDLARVLESMGIRDQTDEGRALYRRLMGAFEGNIDPSGRYHRSPGGWVDVGTSDVAKRGVPGAADYFGGGAGGGMASVLAGLAMSPGGDEDAYFQRLVDAGDWTEWPPGSGQYFNDPGNDPSRRVWVDRKGTPISGVGYRSTAGAERGPTFDYSRIRPGQRIADYLANNYQQDQAQDAAMRTHQENAANAAPYTPGAPNPSMMGGTPGATPAWGASTTYNTKPPSKPTGITQPSALIQPTQPMNSMMGQSVRPQQRKPNPNMRYRFGGM